MKKRSVYILVGLLVAALLLLVIAGGNKRNRTLNERISLRKRDKIPYGSFVTYEHLKHIFPRASVTVTREEPGFWDSLSVYQEEQALLIVCTSFNADNYEMKNLLRFVRNGNTVFISAMDLSYEVTQMLNCEVRTAGQGFFFAGPDDMDTLTVSLADPPFGTPASYTYPGKQYDGYFTKLDTAITTILGYDKKGRPDFIRLKAGEGDLYVHLAPMAFTNYFLLHNNNLPYYEKTLSLISPRTRKVAWDEYYSTKNGSDDKKKTNWFASLMRYPGLKAGLLTAILGLLVYVLLEMRRKQRYIPVIKKPRNDSLDFVKTIGRLYHDKADHQNLSRKMAAYFLEHVRNRYKLPTAELNDGFVKSLHVKTGVAEEELMRIVSFIRGLDQGGRVSESQLASFHKQLESFYKKA